jgi:urease accessory protein
MQLADSFFPSGMFGMSSGLESLSQYGKIRNSNDVFLFIKEQIEFQLIPCDLIALSITFSGVKNNDLLKVTQVDNKYYSMKLTKEIRNSSVRSGRQVFACLKHMVGSIHNKNSFVDDFDSKITSKETPCTYPIALGIIAVCLDIPLQSMIRMLLYSFSSSIVSAAIRLGIIQHLEAQKILVSLAEHVNKILPKTIEQSSLKDMWQLAPLTEIHKMKHEHNSSRMFIT